MMIKSEALDDIAQQPSFCDKDLADGLLIHSLTTVQALIKRLSMLKY